MIPTNKATMKTSGQPVVTSFSLLFLFQKSFFYQGKLLFSRRELTVSGIISSFRIPEAKVALILERFSTMI